MHAPAAGAGYDTRPVAAQRVSIQGVVGLNRSRGARAQGEGPGAAGPVARKRKGAGWHKRLLLTVGAVGVTGVLVTATSFALFTSQSSAQTDAFAAGTVILTSGSSACSFTNMEAGDSHSCTYTVTYTGSLAAWITLGISSTSTAQAASQAQGSATLEGGQALLDPAQPNGLQVTISDNQGTKPQYFTLGTQKCSNIGTGSNLSDPGYQDSCASTATPTLILGQGPDSIQHCNRDNSCITVGGNGAVTKGWTDTFTVTGSLPLTSGNIYQGGNAEINLVANAFQASNNSDVAPSKVTIVSNSTWSTSLSLNTGSVTPLVMMSNTPLGNAEQVCLDPNAPYPVCPSGYVDYHFSGGAGNWSAPLNEIPGARWIWAPGITGSSSTTPRTYYFSKTIYLPAPVIEGDVTLYAAADNSAQVYVNGVLVATVGSQNNDNSSSFNEIHPLSIPGSDFTPGNNTITVEGYNFPIQAGTYQGNPAGVVFGGTLYLASMQLPPP